MSGLRDCAIVDNDTGRRILIVEEKVFFMLASTDHTEIENLLTNWFGNKEANYETRV